MLRHLTPATHPDVLVGLETGDDAGVWRLDDRRALVATVDVITPIVDDARTWGRIAAVNAASDVYAMGGTPLFALNIVAWNHDALSEDLLVEVLSGAADAAAEGGWVTLGGHSIEDPVPKFGLAVVGEVDPQRLLTNAGLRDGDALVLTKPLGTGVIATAIKGGAADAETVDAAVSSMLRSNAAAARRAGEAGATGATDVTGFGLVGHLASAAEASGVDVEVEAAAVPLLPRARALAEDGFVPGGTEQNLAWVRPRLDVQRLDDVTLRLLADPQTSGGLLFGAEPDAASHAMHALREQGHDAAIIGRARAGQGRLRLLSV